MKASWNPRDETVVAHVNYLFFHSTQSFIYFYLSRFQRVRPICLTRAPESAAINSSVPPALADDFYLYRGQRGQGLLERVLWSAGLRMRAIVTRLPPGLTEPVMERLYRRVVPRLRPDVNPSHFLEWAEDILRRRSARIIHAYFGPIGWRMIALKRLLGLPLVVTFLGDEVAPTLAPWWSWWIQSGPEKADWLERLRELFEEGDLFLAEGPYLRQRLIDLGCPPDKIQVQRIALPLDRMPFQLRRLRPDGKTIIVFAGRFCEQKGILYALEAVRELRDERRSIELRLIGDETLTDGRYAARVYAYIRKHHLQDCVRLLGFLNHEDYLQELQRGDLFLHPSIVDDDGVSEGGAPTTILEAQAVGMPVVSTVHCDIPNVTVPGRSALLVPERDSSALAWALRRLIDDPETWESMGRTGRRHMEEFHNIEREAPILEDRYFSLLEQVRDKPADKRMPGAHG